MRNAIASTIAVRGRVIHDCRKAGDVRPRRLTAWGEHHLGWRMQRVPPHPVGVLGAAGRKGDDEIWGMPEVHEAGLSR